MGIVVGIDALGEALAAGGLQGDGGTGGLAGRDRVDAFEQQLPAAAGLLDTAGSGERARMHRAETEIAPALSTVAEHPPAAGLVLDAQVEPAAIIVQAAAGPLHLQHGKPLDQPSSSHCLRPHLRPRLEVSLGETSRASRNATRRRKLRSCNDSQALVEQDQQFREMR